MTNHLAKETSPYLLQHVENPVDWYPWGDKALQRARDENKPIFLSVGYSSCHWCHVMAHESFENDTVAKFMNENFVNIKVDREERPDIDDIYQKVCQAATGQGGWPLSVFLTPDQSPFYVGTYFPVMDSYGRPGFESTCRQIAQTWKENPSDVQRAAKDFVDKLHKIEPNKISKIEQILLDEAAMNLFQLGDSIYGGFGSAPKFPSTANISFLLRYGQMTGHTQITKFALKTLTKMAKGGIFDQIGGGFHRYSTDARWLIPHFEKMLYDNALIPINYIEAYQITKEPFYLDIVQRTLNFVQNEMTSQEGGFYSAYDADSEGIEGKFYVWTKSEIKNILGDDADLFCMYYDVTDGGNWEGSSILYNNIDISAVAFHFGITVDVARAKIISCSKMLLTVRAKRKRPGLDDKILVSWNALMISAFAKGYRISHQTSYLETARKCAKFIITKMLDDQKLLRTYKNNTAKIDAYLEDYAYLANALLDLFEIDADSNYLKLSQMLADVLINDFWDSVNCKFFMTSKNHEQLIIRPRNDYDLSLPSGSSVAVHVLLRLAHILQRDDYKNIVIKIIESQGQSAAENPFAFGYLLNVIAMYLQVPTEITIINPSNSDIYKTLCHRYLPNAIMIAIPDKTRLEYLSKYLFFAGKEFSSDATVFVCKNFTCSRPLHTVSDLDEHL